MRRWIAALAVALCIAPGPALAKQTITIGFNLSMSGDIAGVGLSARNAAELARREVNSRGGVEIGGEKYELKFVYRDNGSVVEQGVAVVQKLCSRSDVLAIIGPNSSKLAVPVGGTCNARATPMVSPWSTHPSTTKNRPWVFRVPYLDDAQSRVAVDFARRTFGARTVGIIFDTSNDHSIGMAEIFRTRWESVVPEGEVVAFEPHPPMVRDYTALLRRVLAAGPDMLYIPDNYNQAARIIRQASALGWDGPIMGSDAWDAVDFVKLCGDPCLNLYFTTNYIATAGDGRTHAFVDRFTVAYGYAPDTVAALTWDAVYLVVRALGELDAVGDDLASSRLAVREALAGIRNFRGVTGTMHFNAQGDPVKCVIVARVNENGEFAFVEEACPEDIGPQGH
ncbi:ABC transporter substrate-binding protein [Desulfobaculum senezii]